MGNTTDADSPREERGVVPSSFGQYVRPPWVKEPKLLAMDGAGVIAVSVQLRGEILVKCDRRPVPLIGHVGAPEALFQPCIDQAHKIRVVSCRGGTDALACASDGRT